MHYRRLLIRGSVNDCGSKIVDIGNEVERFHKKYLVNEQTGCWIWTGGTRRNSKGVEYGRHWLDVGKSEGAHRFSYFLKYGRSLTNNKSTQCYICHHCDTPLCVNPEHLFLSDHRGNMRDMVEKGRSCKTCGQDKASSKLLNIQAEQIRGLLLPNGDIANIYKVSRTTIFRIKNGMSYK